MKNILKNKLLISVSILFFTINTMYFNVNAIEGVVENNYPSLITENMKNTKNESNKVETNGGSVNEGFDNTETTPSTGSLDKAEKYVSNKLYDVIGLFQGLIKPFVYLTFIISAIMIIFGVLFGSKKKFIGFIGMACSVLVYVLVAYSPQLIEFFGAWLSV